MTVYNPGFYQGQVEGSMLSARAVVPIIMDVIKPKSAIDIGCGVAHWSSVFREHGVEVAQGMDGPWARSAGLKLADQDFVEFDFGAATPPFQIATPLPKYDLLTSFEFVEHIDEDRADHLADLFCSLADILIIGGAVPLQGGTHHVNEQWPDYWAEKFARRGFAACDFIRPAVWANEAVEPWYAQNSIAYFRGSVPTEVQVAAEGFWKAFASNPPRLIHPALWTKRPHSRIEKVRDAIRLAVS